MKYILSLVFCFFCFFGFSQTQAELNTMQYESYKKTDKKLNEVYQAILKAYKSDTEFIKNLRTSQRIWITFREAEVKVKYPEREDGYYGTIHPLCVSLYLEDLTLDRISTLNLWLKGSEEGDACSGSIKTN
jgi:uncharacterized protein YecT (DUF1311 family)